MREHNVAGLLADESFINYCFGRNPNDLLYWSSYLAEHPHTKESIEELKAIALLTSRSAHNTEMQWQLDKLKQQIGQKETEMIAKVSAPTLTSPCRHKKDIT